MFDQITPEGGKLTVLALVERYVSLKNNVRPSTEASYRTVMNILKKDPFGSKRIDKVKLSEAKFWLVQMQKNGRGFSSIRTIRGIMRPAFQLAVDDDLIRKNPFAFKLMSVVYNDSVTREAISHTFCSRMAAARMNPKTLQYIMGHSDISVTMNVYTHLGFEEASEEVERITKAKAKKSIRKVG